MLDPFLEIQTLKLTPEENQNLISPVTGMKIWKNAIKSIGQDKAPGPDGLKYILYFPMGSTKTTNS